MVETESTHTRCQPAPDHSSHPVQGPRCAWGAQFSPAQHPWCTESPAHTETMFVTPYYSSQGSQISKDYCIKERFVYRGFPTRMVYLKHDIVKIHHSGQAILDINVFSHPTGSHIPSSGRSITVTFTYLLPLTKTGHCKLRDLGSYLSIETTGHTWAGTRLDLISSVIIVLSNHFVWHTNKHRSICLWQAEVMRGVRNSLHTDTLKHLSTDCLK